MVEAKYFPDLCLLKYWITRIFYFFIYMPPCLFTMYPQYVFHYCQRNLPSTVSHVLKTRELDADNKPQREKKMKIHVLVRQLYSSKLEQDSFSNTNSWQFLCSLPQVSISLLDYGTIFLVKILLFHLAVEKDYFCSSLNFSFCKFLYFYAERLL